MTIPIGVTSIGYEAFRFDFALTCVNFLGNAPTLGNDEVFWPYHSEFAFKARVGATGFDTGVYAAKGVEFELAITSLEFDPGGNLVIWTDALEIPTNLLKKVSGWVENASEPLG